MTFGSIPVRWLGVFSLLVVLANPLTAFGADSSSVVTDDGQRITRHTELVEASGPADKFHGAAVFTRFPIMPSSGAVAPATVSFSAGALTNWHVHPHGQYLIVVDGEGRTQEWGKRVQTIRAGDTVWCPPGVKHWHGGGESTAMTHVAISPVSDDGQSVTWLEPVARAESASPQGVQAESQSELLTQRQLAIAPIAGFNAIGDLEGLKPALEAGLARGLTINDIKEVFAHQYAYVGFPRSLNGLLSFRTLLEERRRAGIADDIGVAATRRPPDTNYYVLGTETLKDLTGGSGNTPMYEFAPAVDYALKVHLFGYLFGRDNLGYIDREITTIATLAGLGNVNSQLISHFKVARNLGLSQEQLSQIITTLGQSLGPAVAENAAQQLATLDD